MPLPKPGLCHKNLYASVSLQSLRTGGENTHHGHSRYTWYKQLTGKGLFWVTCARKGRQYEVASIRPVVKDSYVISDQIVRLDNQCARKAGAYDIHRVEYLDPDNGKTYAFITNQKTGSAQTVADIYKSRREVEWFFKWIKQNLKIKNFLGNTINAVALQIFVALCVYLLVVFQRFLPQTAYGLERGFRLVHINALVRKPIADLLCPKKHAPPDPQIPFTLRAA